MAHHKHNLTGRPVDPTILGQAPGFQVYCTEEGCDFEVTKSTPPLAWYHAGAMMSSVAAQRIIDQLEAYIAMLTGGWAFDETGIIPPEVQSCSCGAPADRRLLLGPIGEHSGSVFDDARPRTGSYSCAVCNRKWSVTWRPIELTVKVMSRGVTVKELGVSEDPEGGDDGEDSSTAQIH